MIKNIVFDIGMVLVDFRWYNYMLDIGIKESEIGFLSDVMVNGPLWGELDRGVRSEAEVIVEMKRRAPGYEAEIDLFWKEVRNIVESFPYAAGWLKGLKERGYRIYLLSNYPERLFKLNMEKEFTFIQHTDGRVISGMVKMVKPEPEIYRYLLSHYELKPEETVFIDDRTENIAAAEAQGIHGIVMENYEKTNAKLEELLSKEQ